VYFDKRKITGFASVFVILISAYLYTIAPTVSLWDCGEFIACSHILGIPHPPGTPFFILIGRIFDIFLPFKEVAKRINFLSALSTAVAGGFLYLIILSIFHRFSENRGKMLPFSCHLVAVFSAIGAGLAYSVWDTSVETEVYASSTLILVIGLWLALHWDENRDSRGSDNYLLLLVYLIFLSFGLHLMPLLLIPGTLVFVIMRRRKIFNNQKLIIFSVVLIIIGISTYYYLMVRAHNNPAINEADPSNFKALWDVISREQYGPMKMFPRQTQVQTHFSTYIALFEQIKIFFKYFSWQFLPYPRESTTNTLLRYTSITGIYLYILTGLWGMFIHFRKERSSFWLFFILYILLSLGLVVYLNLKFSPSDPNPAHQEREVRERDYFWSSAFFFFMFYVSIGLYWVHKRIKKTRSPLRYSGLAIAFLMGLAPMISNENSHVNRRGNWIASDYSHNLLVTPDDYSILFTYGDNDTFPLWYLQEVKGFRKFDSENKKGVQPANFSLMNTPWYIKQLKLSGIPMDFASPFRGTNMERVYQIKKRSGETNLEFEDWIIKNISPLKCEDGSWLRPADIVVRNIILSSIGIKPSFQDFIMPADLFVDKYLQKTFNPSINIYFSFPAEAYSSKIFQHNFEMEGFAYRLVGKENNNSINYGKMFNKLASEFKTSYCENPTIYTGRAQNKPLANHTYIYLTFGEYALSKFIEKERDFISGSDRDTLTILENIFEKAFIFTMNSKLSIAVTPQVANNLKKIYSLLKEEERATDFCDSLLSISNPPSLHLLRGEMLTLKATSKKEKTEDFEEAKKEFKYLLNYEDFKPYGYVGLIGLHFISNEQEKIKEIILDIGDHSSLSEKIIFFAIRYRPEVAIKMFEVWKEIYPNEAIKFDQLIKRLQAAVEAEP
jgi:tetratricopeptide (TPR) repeat protein